MLGEGIGNLKHTTLPEIRGSRHYLGRALLAGIQVLANGFRIILGSGRVQPPHAARSMAPTGYHVVYRKGS